MIYSLYLLHLVLTVLSNHHATKGNITSALTVLIVVVVLVLVIGVVVVSIMVGHVQNDVAVAPRVVVTNAVPALVLLVVVVMIGMMEETTVTTCSNDLTV
jgi:hypothetical protein